MMRVKQVVQQQMVVDNASAIVVVSSKKTDRVNRAITMAIITMVVQQCKRKSAHNSNHLYKQCPHQRHMFLVKMKHVNPSSKVYGAK